jgi:DNA-binding transcriptional LysR family regulator
MDLVRQEKLDMAIVDTTNRDRSLHFRKLCQRNLFAALPEGHPLAEAEALAPQELSQQSQVVFNSNFGSFGHWASGAAGEEHIVCTVNTAETALDLVAAGVGFCLMSEACVTARAGVRFVPVKNWYQAQYMCILYDKWLEPPIWSFVEKLVKTIRSLEATN